MVVGSLVVYHVMEEVAETMLSACTGKVASVSCPLVVLGSKWYGINMIMIIIILIINFPNKHEKFDSQQNS